VTAALTHFLHNLRRPNTGPGPTDAQLVDGFLTGRDEEAFAALVHRHGPMVLGVCRRILGNSHDAEDAFQATFLVLACKAGAVRPRHMLAGWLYGVACNTALKLRGAAARRRLKEKEAAAMPRPDTSADGWRQLEPLLDGAVRGLPDKYRVPIVLCELEGKSRKEAARLLGWPEGTVASRLARARQMLSRRLARHGTVLSASAVAALFAQNEVCAQVPPALTASLIKVAPLVASGQTTLAALPDRVAALTQGVLRAMFMTKLKLATVLFLVLALLGLGAAWLPSAASPQTTTPQGSTGGSSVQVDPAPKTGGSSAAKTGGSSVQVDPAPKTGTTARPEQPKSDKDVAPASITVPDVIVDEVDLKHKTISVTLASGSSTASGTTGAGSGTSGSTSAKPTRIIDLPVDKHVEIIVNREVVPLGGLKVGMKVSLRLTLNGGQLIVASAFMGKREDVTGIEFRLKEAEEKLAAATAQAEEAAVRLQVARAALEKAKAEAERARAQADVDEARALLDWARREAQVEAERAEKLRRDAELRRAKGQQQ
jgi:RNA polymerase sigma factor (sigma-70 family)